MPDIEKKITVIDTDSIIYIAGWSVKDSRDKQLGITALNDHIFRILKDTNATHYMGFFQKTSNNFRYKIYPEYKANRKKDPDEWLKFWKPIFLEVLEEQWGFVDVSAHSMESDDAMRIAFDSLCQQYDPINELVLAYIDKDLNNIYSNHAPAHIWFNYKNKGWFQVRKERSMYFFWKQMITGDNTDNIKGVPGKGPKAAEKLLDPIQDNPRAMFYTVYREYLKIRSMLRPEAREYFLQTLNCVNLLQTKEGFELPEIQEVPDLMDKLKADLLNI